MEFSDYGRILRKWKALIICGTLVGLLAGFTIAFASESSGARYEAKTTVVLNYTLPNGTPYNQTVSPRTDANLLLSAAHNPLALNGANPNLPIQGVSSVSAEVDPNLPNVVVTVTASSAAAATLGAKNVATFMADQENAKVAQLVSALHKRDKVYAKGYRAHYMKLLAQYDAVCGCTSAGGVAKLGAVELGALEARVNHVQQLWQNELTTAQALYDMPTRPATTIRGRTKPAPNSSGSPIRTILPATMLAFLLSAGAAAFLDFRSARGSTFSFITKGSTPSLPRPRLPIIGRLSKPQPLLATSDGDAVKTRAAILKALERAATETAGVVTRLIGSGNRCVFVAGASSNGSTAEPTIALAAAFARQGSRVVVIDAQPEGEVSEFFGHGSQPGLIDYLAYPAMAVAGLVHPVELEPGHPGKLAVLPAGVMRSRIPDTGLVNAWTDEHAKAWDTALTEMASEADIVIVNGDAPLRHEEAAIMAGACEGTLIIDQPDGSASELARANTILREHRASILGVVVNSGTDALRKHGSVAAPEPAVQAPGLEPAREMQESA